MATPTVRVVPVSEPVSGPVTGPVSRPDDDLSLRGQLSSLRGLLALSILMTDRRQVDQIVQLASTAVPALVPCRAVGLFLHGTGWRPALPGVGEDDDALVAQVARLPRAGGPVTLQRSPWGWAFPLSTPEREVGWLVVAGDAEPTAADQVLLRSLAQQTGIALANADVHARERSANAALAETVAALERQTAIHDRFTQVALAGGGRDGIAAALHELTGLTAGVEDRSGTLLAWAGTDPPPASQVRSSRREQSIDRALRLGHPVRSGDRVLAVARPRADVLGVVFVHDPWEQVGEAELVALEHAATVLAMELARLLSLAETELRLGVDLVADLIGGVGDGVAARADALGLDLSRPHRVVAIGGGDRAEGLLLAVQEIIGRRRPSLLMQRGTTVVVLAPVGPPGAVPLWDRLAEKLSETSGRRHCRVGIGGVCLEAADYPRSHRQAQLALRLAEQATGTTGERRTALCYDQLGVYQLLAEVQDQGQVDAFVQRWLQPLLEYDRRRGSQLVETLTRYLDCGGSYDLTAESMALGRSTVRYRLSRIRQICGHDLADPDTRFQLQLATRALTTVRALSQDDSATPATTLR